MKTTNKRARNTEEHISVRYPVQYGSPALHSDTLEDGEHGEADVVEAGDTAVWSLPLIHADRGVGVAYVGTLRCIRFVIRVARTWQIALLHYLI